MTFSVREGDVAEVASDLLLLKYAQAFYGADQAVASKLVARRVCALTDLQPRPGDAVTLETRGAIASTRVMFLGAPPLLHFGYDEMEAFARTAVEKIAELRMPVPSITTTIHGEGYGLDGGEALLRLIHGFQAAISDRRPAIESITFLTLSARSARMLAAALKTASAEPSSDGGAAAGPSETIQRLEPTARSGGDIDSVHSARRIGLSVVKAKVFVAMPFSEEFDNVYEFGIYPAVRNCGLICERVDETHFTGDVLERIRGGIEGADLVVADLTEGRPNVYLEVGYAWGRGVPVIFVAKKGEKLHFDVSTHRCIFYGSFTKFAQELEKLLRGIGAVRPG